MDDKENQQPQPNQAPNIQMPATSLTTEMEPPTRQYVEPTPFQPDHTLQAPEPPVLLPTPKRKRKLLLVGIIIAAVLVVFAGSGALAYKLWYQNPDKVIGDALVNAMKAKSTSYDGTVNATGKDGMKARGTFNGNSKDGSSEFAGTLAYEMAGKKFTLDGDGILDSKGSLYFKVNGLDTVMNVLGAQTPPYMKGVINQFVVKVNDKWVKLDADDTKSFSESYAKAQKCFAAASQQLQSDKTIASEVADAYKRNQFITVDQELGSEAGSLGYRLKGDNVKSKAFIGELRQTKFYASLHECDKDVKISDNAVNISESVKTDVWISRWTHEITKLSISSEKDGTTTSATIKPKFNQATDIKMPEKTMTAQQFVQEVMLLVRGSFMTPPSATPDRGSGNETDLFSLRTPTTDV